MLITYIQTRWSLSLSMKQMWQETLVARRKLPSGIYAIRRIGDREFSLEASPEGLLDGTGAESMEVYKKENLKKFPVQRRRYAGSEDDIIRYGKNTVFRFIEHATIAPSSSSTCGGKITVHHIPPPGMEPTMDEYVKGEDGVYGQITFNGVPAFPV